MNRRDTNRLRSLPVEPLKRCVEVKYLGEIGEVAPEVAELAMKNRSRTARSLSSFTFSDTFANSISRFNPIYANLNSLPEIKVGTISARD